MSRIAQAATRHATRRRPVALALLVLIAATSCGVVGKTSVKSVQIALQGKPDVEPTTAGVAANRFPQIKVTGPAGGAILVLGNIDSGRQAWYSSERSIVFFRDGIVAGTHGSTPELLDMAIDGASPFHTLHRIANGTTVKRRYDVMPDYRYGMNVTGTFATLGREKVRILESERDLLHVRERLQGNGWKRDNHYWVDPANGFIWKSIQAIAPDTSLEVVQLKPFSQDLQNR
ncbi:YjbF family lipoprotein [Stenotrophomonas maltophilia]|uniref:YjbF family lipoprotein n=1 Tax=Stenotrophomonas maltophilia TaxID=40324 RepID=UPI001076452D|nr:YjbF family lipoprotein [Stenotrophomonas maltophilia]TFZ45647.1 YjbF family lipoprotein [Stenotrophomonas maltophilia]